MKSIQVVLVFFTFLCYSSSIFAQNSIGIQAIGKYKGETLYGVYQLNKKTNTNDWVAFLTPTGNETYKYIYQKKDKPLKPYVKLFDASVIQDLNFDKVKGYLEVTESIGFTVSSTDKKVYSKITLNSTELFDAVSKAKIIQPEDMMYVAEVLGTFIGENVYGVYQKNTQNQKNWMYFLLPTKYQTETYLYHENDTPSEAFTKVYDKSILDDFDLSKVLGYVEVKKNIEYMRSTATSQIFSLININGTDLFYYFEKNKMLTSIEKERLAKEKITQSTKKKYESPYLKPGKKPWGTLKTSKIKTCPVCGGSGKEYLAERNSNTYTTYTEDDANYYKKTKTSNGNYYRKVKCYKCKGSGKVKQ